LNASRSKPIEPDWTTALKDRLERAPNIPVNIGPKLEALVICHMDKICDFSDNELENIVRSSLRNPSVKSLKRAAVLSALGYYLVNVRQDNIAALTVMRETVEAAPLEIPYRLTYASFLSALNHAREAKEQLDIAKGLDVLNVHAARIEEQRKLLYSQNH
jgi:hypothetical protein